MASRLVRDGSDSARGAATPIVDLSVVEEADRSFVWSGLVRSLFPGLSVNRIEAEVDVGHIRRVVLDGGEIWQICSPSIDVRYAPTRAQRREDFRFSVMVLEEGEIEVAQHRRVCALRPGDVCLLDEQAPFAIDSAGSGDILFMRLPRSIVLGRNPHLEHQTAIGIKGEAAGAALLGSMLRATLLNAPFLEHNQRRSALIATIELLGTLAFLSDEMAGPARWRVQAALSFVELHYARHGLAADEVAQAQRISRRRLDQLLSETTGFSITGHIWKRRLDQAALDLCDHGRATCTASQIAFTNGFEDAAHFARAFKRRFGHSPLKWRALRQAPFAQAVPPVPAESTCLATSV